MHQQIAPPELVELGHGIVDQMAHALAAGSGTVHLQLLASWLYEAVKAELARTPPEEPARSALLAAAAERCRRATDGTGSPASMLIELRAAVAMLERGRLEPWTVPPVRRKPELRVIRGGLA